MDYKSYFAIEGKLRGQGFDFDRSEAVSTFTSGKKTGLTELTPGEYKEFIKWLNEKLNNQVVVSSPSRGSGKDHAQIQRRKIIALLCKVGMVQDGKADMNRIYSWVLSHGYLKKSMNLYTTSELPKLVYQAEELYRKHIEKL